MMHVFYAFCGGAFGAMLGGSAAFALTGVFCAISMAALFGGIDFVLSQSIVGGNDLTVDVGKGDSIVVEQV